MYYFTFLITGTKSLLRTLRKDLYWLMVLEHSTMVAQSNDLGENTMVVGMCERKQGEGDKVIREKMLPRAYLQ